MASAVLKLELNIDQRKDDKLRSIIDLLQDELVTCGPTSDAPFEALSALYHYTRHNLDDVDSSSARKHNFKTKVDSYLSLMQFGGRPQTIEVRNFLAGWIGARN